MRGMARRRPPLTHTRSSCDFSPPYIFFVQKKEEEKTQGSVGVSVHRIIFSAEKEEEILDSMIFSLVP
jgi:hypothetical protein